MRLTRIHRVKAIENHARDEITDTDGADLARREIGQLDQRLVLKEVFDPSFLGRRTRGPAARSNVSYRAIGWRRCTVQRCSRHGHRRRVLERGAIRAIAQISPSLIRAVRRNGVKSFN